MLQRCFCPMCGRSVAVTAPRRCWLAGERVVRFHRPWNVWMGAPASEPCLGSGMPVPVSECFDPLSPPCGAWGSHD